MATRSDKTAKVAELEKRLKTLVGELDSNKQIVEDMLNRQRELRGMCNEVDTQIRQLRVTIPENLEVTNHALLRFCERRYGLQVEAIKKEILDLVKGAELGLDEVKFNGFVIKNNAVITYLPSAVDVARDPTLSFSSTP